MKQTILKELMRQHGMLSRPPPSEGPMAPVAESSNEPAVASAPAADAGTAQSDSSGASGQNVRAATESTSEERGDAHGSRAESSDAVVGGAAELTQAEMDRLDDAIVQAAFEQLYPEGEGAGAGEDGSADESDSSSDTDADGVDEPSTDAPAEESEGAVVAVALMASEAATPVAASTPAAEAPGAPSASDAKGEAGEGEAGEGEGEAGEGEGPIVNRELKRPEGAVHQDPLLVREYCDQVISPELTVSTSLNLRHHCRLRTATRPPWCALHVLPQASCDELLAELYRLQLKMHEKDPVKASTRKRYVTGLREVYRALKMNKAKVPCPLDSGALHRGPRPSASKPLAWLLLPRVRSDRPRQPTPRPLRPSLRPCSSHTTSSASRRRMGSTR